MHCACAIFSSVVCQAVQYFYTLSHIGTICGENVNEHKMRVLIFSTALSKLCLIMRIAERGTIKNVYWPSCKMSVIPVRF
jgi:hypothetical protein